MQIDWNRHQFVIVFFGIIAGALVVQSLFPPSVKPIDWKAEAEDLCKGEPITVAYTFEGSVRDPHDCKVQCEDDEPRYILYTNGVGTQCGTPPNCFDWGEDNGVTCVVPDEDLDLLPSMASVMEDRSQIGGGDVDDEEEE